MEFGFQYLIEIRINHALLDETARQFTQQRKLKQEHRRHSTNKFRGLTVYACFAKQRFSCLIFFLGPRKPITISKQPFLELLTNSK